MKKEKKESYWDNFNLEKGINNTNIIRDPSLDFRIENTQITPPFVGYTKLPRNIADTNLGVDIHVNDPILPARRDILPEPVSLPDLSKSPCGHRRMNPSCPFCGYG